MKRSEMYAILMTMIPFAIGFALLKMTIVALVLSCGILLLAAMVKERRNTMAVCAALLHMGLLYGCGYREVALLVVASVVTYSCMVCAGKRYAGMVMDRNLYLVAGLFYGLIAVYFRDYEGLVYVMSIYAAVLYRLFVPAVVQKRLEMRSLSH